MNFKRIVLKKCPYTQEDYYWLILFVFYSVPEEEAKLKYHEVLSAGQTVVGIFNTEQQESYFNKVENVNLMQQMHGTGPLLFIEDL